MGAPGPDHATPEEHVTFRSILARRFRPALVAAALVPTLALAACGGDSGTGPVDGETYTLETVDGRPLPYVYEDNSEYKDELLASSITFDDEDTYTARFTVRFTDRTVSPAAVETFTESIEGGYSRSGSNLTFRDEDGNVEIVATLSGDQLTWVDADDGNTTYVYRR